MLRHSNARLPGESVLRYVSRWYEVHLQLLAGLTKRHQLGEPRRQARRDGGGYEQWEEGALCQRLQRCLLRNYHGG